MLRQLVSAPTVGKAKNYAKSGFCARVETLKCYSSRCFQVYRCEMVVIRLRSPQKRNSLSQISKRIRNTFDSIRKRVRRGFFFTHTSDKVNHATIEVLPLEIMFNVFEFSTEKLSKLCLSNHRMLKNVSKYVSSELFARRFYSFVASIDVDDETVADHYASTGCLLRCCSIFLDTKELINAILRFYDKVYHRVGRNYGWTFFFSEALQNVSQAEYVDFMNAIIKRMDIQTLSERVISSTLKLAKEELKLRRLLFSHFLDDCEIQTVPLRLRLSAILRMLSPLKMEYKLLMILGAPVVRDEDNGIEFIDYESPYIEVINDPAMLKSILGEISELTEELSFTNDLEVVHLRWTEMQIFNLMETITTHPEPWVLPNFAAFLLCSPRLARLAIYTRAIYGSVTEAGYTLFSCVEMAVHLGRDPYVILHMAAREVSARCTMDICVTMLRESIVNAQQRCVEVFNAVTGASDRDFLHETLEVTKQIAGLFQNMLYLIFN